MSLDYRYLVIQIDENENLSKVTEFTSLDNLIVVKISLHKNNCNKDNYKNKELCFKFDDKHYLIDWNMDNIDINDVQSNMLDINFLNLDDKLEQRVTATNQNSDTDKALGLENTANSDTDKALGLENTANSDTDKALGLENTANSDTDKALGLENTANSDTDKYYKALGLENTANSEEIKKAYHTLALQYHPDKGGDPVKFNEIQNAYNCLIKEDCS
jgi:DnaJ-domain-containing protein 1